MSKYIKLDDAIHNINLEVVGRKEYTGDMKANLFFALDDLPTIEVSEKVEDERCKGCKHYKLACDLFSEICKYEPITQTETQNSNLTFEIADTPKAKVSEDCISREWILEEYQKGKEMMLSKSECFDELIWLVLHAPSVVPKEKEKERTAYKPIRIDGFTEKCPKCDEKVMYAVGTGIMFHGASESYEDWRVIKHNYCPKCGTKIEREGE